VALRLINLYIVFMIYLTLGVFFNLMKLEKGHSKKLLKKQDWIQESMYRVVQ